MLSITIPAKEYYDEILEQFVYRKEQTIQLEHSLVSISKWESKWKKAYLGDKEKTKEESVDYIRCMTITQNIDPTIYYSITSDSFDQIISYINDKRTATVFTDLGDDGKISKKSRETITSELIYYWMIALDIPLECQKWHLNRLLTLVKVCNIKNTPPKKMSASEVAARNRRINAERRSKYQTKG